MSAAPHTTDTNTTETAITMALSMVSVVISDIMLYITAYAYV